MDVELNSAVLGGLITENELGAVVKQMSPAQAQAVNAIVNKTAASANLSRIASPAQLLLQSKAQDLSSETIRKWKEGTIKIQVAEYYVRRLITSKNGIFDLLDSTVDKVEGYSNIDKQRLDDGKNLAVSRVELGIDTQAGITAVTADLAPVTNAEDNAVYNGEIELTADGETKFKLPVNSFNIPRENGSPANGFNFATPILLKERQVLKARLYLVGDGVSATATVFEVKLIGEETANKA